jgi:hypothetical protein
MLNTSITQTTAPSYKPSPSIQIEEVKVEMSVTPGYICMVSKMRKWWKLKEGIQENLA